MPNLALLSIAALLSVALTAPGAAAMSPARGTQVARPACFGPPATLVGTRGDDVLVGTPGRDVIVAGAGNDVVRPRGGADIVCGGPGNDRIVDRAAHGERDLFRGGAGNDRLTSAKNGFLRNRILHGGPGADRLVNAGTSRGMIRGGSGPDILKKQGRHGWLRGGAGTDRLIVAGTGVTDLTLTADGDRVRIHSSRTGSLSIFLAYLKTPAPIDLDLAAGTVRRVGAATGDVITHVGSPSTRTTVSVTGSRRDDRMRGTDSGELLHGIVGNDIVNGRGGPDELHGGPGDDILLGRNGPDNLNGWMGDDVLHGGHGHDRARGGKGSDTCTAERVRTCSP